MNFNWKRWKVGLLIAILSGIFTSMMGFSLGAGWKVILGYFVINVGKDGLLYLQSHPVDSIQFDTQFVKKTQADGSSVESTHRTTTVQNPPTT